MVNPLKLLLGSGGTRATALKIASVAPFGGVAKTSHLKTPSLLWSALWHSRTGLKTLR